MSVPLFCEHCAQLTRSFSYDPTKKPFVELMSGSCMWADELSHDWCTPCTWAMRALFRLRYCMTVGDPLNAETLKLWRRLELEFPDWPLFRQERRSPENAEELRRLVHRKTKRFCISMERLDRKYRKRQAEREGLA